MYQNRCTEKRGRITGMTMNDIRNILAIAEHGRITKAAHALYISQPSLSQCLQKVENELGVRLFERNRFGECKPTEAGRIFIEEGNLLFLSVRTKAQKNPYILFET